MCIRSGLVFRLHPFKQIELHSVFIHIHTLIFLVSVQSCIAPLSHSQVQKSMPHSNLGSRSKYGAIAVYPDSDDSGSPPHSQSASRDRNGATPSSGLSSRHRAQGYSQRMRSGSQRSHRLARGAVPSSNGIHMHHEVEPGQDMPLRSQVEDVA